MFVLTFRQMTMEMVESQQDDNAAASVPKRVAAHLQNQPGRSHISPGSEVSGNIKRTSKVTFRNAMIFKLPTCMEFSCSICY